MSYRSDKNLVQDLFFPFNLTVMALESLGKECGEPLANNLRNKTHEYLNEFCAKEKVFKLAKRVELLTHYAIRDIGDKKKLSGHKYILLLYSLAELVIAEGGYIPEFLEDIFNEFLELESKEKLDNEEWLKLKASAEKQACKILIRLKEQGYFLNKP